MRQLSDVGEFGLIERIIRRIGDPRSSRVLLGPGDDAAVLRPPAGRDLVVSTDALVEDVHFRWCSQAPATVGRRALLVNLSDLAAMGATPLGFVVALAAPPTLALARAEGLIAGLLREARAHACPLVGGNVAAARETSLAVTVFGSVAPGRALRRDAGRPGDRIFVTGSLGGAGLARIRAERTGARLRKLPVPRLAAGRALARIESVNGCIDISDGLVADLGHLLAKAGRGAEIDPGRIPCPQGFGTACRRLGVDSQALLLGGGEDYELLFSLGARARLSEAALARRLAVPVAEIGRVTARPGISGLPAGGGWRHF
jgi:thiamine-monophosphate kinase